jgi:hypothetical protein
MEGSALDEPRRSASIFELYAQLGDDWVDFLTRNPIFRKKSTIVQIFEWKESTTLASMRSKWRETLPRLEEHLGVKGIEEALEKLAQLASHSSSWMSVEDLFALKGQPAPSAKSRVPMKRSANMVVFRSPTYFLSAVSHGRPEGSDP